MQVARIVRMLLLIPACCAVSYAHGQAVIKSTDTLKKSHPVVPPKPKGPKPIKHEFSGGFRLNTDGWGIFTEFGKVKSKDVKHADMFYKSRVWQIEFAEKKNPKEEKQAAESATGSGTNKYVYGKIN